MFAFVGHPVSSVGGLVAPFRVGEDDDGLVDASVESGLVRCGADLTFVQRSLTRVDDALTLVSRPVAPQPSVVVVGIDRIRTRSFRGRGFLHSLNGIQRRAPNVPSSGHRHVQLCGRLPVDGVAIRCGRDGESAATDRRHAELQPPVPSLGEQPMHNRPTVWDGTRLTLCHVVGSHRSAPIMGVPVVVRRAPPDLRRPESSGISLRPHPRRGRTLRSGLRDRGPRDRHGAAVPTRRELTTTSGPTAGGARGRPGPRSCGRRRRACDTPQHSGS